MTFKEYTESKHIELSSYSTEFVNYLEEVYTKLHMSLTPFLSPSKTEDEIRFTINESIRKQYRIQYHNIGKNPNQRYYEAEGRYCWLKLEHFLITHLYAIKKSSSKISNKTIAIKIGWLSKTEKDPEVIAKALRKVSDNLTILKRERNTFTVEHKFVYGKKGSYHVISANWLNIIKLYTKYNTAEEGSIRLRKSIKYRIISLLRTTARKFSNSLAELIIKQQRRFLKQLVTLDLDQHYIMKVLMNGLLRKHKELCLPEKIGTKDIVFSYDSAKNIVIFDIKNEWLNREIRFAEDEIRDEVKAMRMNADLQVNYCK